MEWGEMSQEMECENLQDVERQPGYYHLLPSKRAKNLALLPVTLQIYQHTAVRSMQTFTRVFKDVIDQVVNTQQILRKFKIIRGR